MEDEYRHRDTFNNYDFPINYDGIEQSKKIGTFVVLGDDKLSSMRQELIENHVIMGLWHNTSYVSDIEIAYLSLLRRKITNHFPAIENNEAALVWQLPSFFVLKKINNKVNGWVYCEFPNNPTKNWLKWSSRGSLKYHAKKIKGTLPSPDSIDYE